MSQNLSNFLGTDSLFGEVLLASPDLAAFLFNETDVYDSHLLIQYGQRTMFEPMTTMTREMLVKTIVSKHRSRWMALVKRELLSEGNVNSRREITETITRIEDRVNESSGTNKVSAFNSTTLVDNDGSVTTGSDGLTGESNKLTVDEQIDVKKAYDMLTINSRDTILESVVSDVSSFLTLSIY